MHELSRVLVENWNAKVASTCKDLTDANSWNEEDVESLLAKLVLLGIVDCGKMRAHWMLHRTPYLPWRDTTVEWIADLLLAIRLIERETSSTAALAHDGTVSFHSESGLIGRVGVAHGRGAFSWSGMEPSIQRQYGARPTPLNGILVAGCPTASTTVSPPVNIANDEPEDSLVGGPVSLQMVNVYDLREDPSSARRIW